MKGDSEVVDVMIGTTVSYGTDNTFEGGKEAKEGAMLIAFLRWGI